MTDTNQAPEQVTEADAAYDEGQARLLARLLSDDTLDKIRFAILELPAPWMATEVADTIRSILRQEGEKVGINRCCPSPHEHCPALARGGTPWSSCQCLCHKLQESESLLEYGAAVLERHAAEWQRLATGPYNSRWAEDAKALVKDAKKTAKTLIGG